MYAILIEDAISEKASVLSTLAADDMAAMVLMLTTAEGWCCKQVQLGYDMSQDDLRRQVTVTCGASVVLTITAQPINGLVGSTELTAFTRPRIN